MTCDSSGCATVFSTTSADAPGKVALTCTCGGTMSGNCDTGIRMIASAPASVITIAITIASRGRSTNIPEIILAYLPAPEPEVLPLALPLVPPGGLPLAGEGLVVLVASAAAACARAA